MSITVRSIDEAGIIKKLKDLGDKETLNYIQQLKEHYEIQRDLTARAIQSLRKAKREVLEHLEKVYVRGALNISLSSGQILFKMQEEIEAQLKELEG